MANSLQRLDIRTARLAASNVLAVLLATPASSAVPTEQLTTVESNFLAEIANRARVSVSSLDEKAKTKLLEVANDELSSLVLGDVKPTDISNHLGSLGLLDISRYQLVETEGFKSMVEYAGLQSPIALKTVKNPDAYQHLHAPGQELDGDGLLSLFVRVLNRDSDFVKSSGSADWLIVLARRNGKKLNLIGAYRVLEDEVGHDARNGNPVDLLRAFVERYGLEMTLGAKPIGKFLVYSSIPLLEQSAIKVRDPSSSRFQLSGLFKWNAETKVMEIAMAFAIDLSEYSKTIENRIS